MDLLYTPYELYTDNRKWNQILMLKQIVINLKDLFNEEYDKFMDDKRDQIYLIAEWNQKIWDLLENL